MRDGYSDSAEGALWTAVRILEESAALERRLSAEAVSRADTLTADRFSYVATSREEQAGMIREMLMAKRNSQEKPTRLRRTIIAALENPYEKEQAAAKKTSFGS